MLLNLPKIRIPLFTDESLPHMGRHRVGPGLDWRPCCSTFPIGHRVDPLLVWPPGRVEAIARPKAQEVVEGDERCIRVATV